MGKSCGALQFIYRGLRDEAIEILELAGLLVTPITQERHSELAQGG